MPERKISIYASGFNAFGQISSVSNEDVCYPQTLFRHEINDTTEDIKLLFAGWSETAFHQRTNGNENGQLIRYGSTNIQLESPLPDPISAFGDHNGLLGFLNREGKTAFVVGEQVEVHVLSTSITPDGHVPCIAHLAIAGNGHVAVAVTSTNSRECGVMEFDSFETFRWWYEDQANDKYGPTALHNVPSRIAQLIANVTGFVCLTRDGNVYTWGDARHNSLGRSVAETEANTPGLVDSLAGIKIKKISSDGWMTAALSEDGAAYLFGTATPGTRDSITCLHDIESTEAALVDIGEGGEPLDILDIAVGDGHVVLLVQNGRVFAAGENQNGQLGLGQNSTRFVQDWTEVEMPGHRQCTAVHAGPKTSFFEIEA